MDPTNMILAQSPAVPSELRPERLTIQEIAEAENISQSFLS
jgi:hypothetical protein